MRAVCTVGGEGEGAGAAVGRWGRVRVPRVDELVQGMKVVAVAAVVEVAFLVAVLWIGSFGCVVLRVLGVGGLEGLGLVLVLEVWILHVLVLRVWVLNVLILHARVLHRWILHVLLLQVWVLNVLILHVRILLLRLLSLIDLCLGRLSTDEIFLLHVGGGCRKSLCCSYAAAVARRGCSRIWWCSCGQNYS